MKKSLDISQVLKNFEGENIKNEKDQDFTLKMVLMAYLRNTQAMGLSDNDLTTAYQLGFALGASVGAVELTTTEYDTLKRLSDTKGKVKGGNGQEGYLFGVEVSGQVKEMVDKATSIE